MSGPRPHHAGPARLRFSAENRRGGAAEILAVVDRADAGADAEFYIRHLALAAFAANLPDGFDHVEHAAGGRRLATVDHAAAGLDRQIAFEREVGLLEKGFVVAAAKTQIFALDHDTRDVFIVSIQPP